MGKKYEFNFSFATLTILFDNFLDTSTMKQPFNRFETHCIALIQSSLDYYERKFKAKLFINKEMFEVKFTVRSELRL